MNSIKCSTGDYELVYSQIINVLDNEFKIQIDGIAFQFGFTDTKQFKGSKMGIDKEPTNGVYNVYICNFDAPDLTGFYEPMILGTVNGEIYYFNLSGWAIKGKEFNVIILNILRKIKNV